MQRRSTHYTYGSSDIPFRLAPKEVTRTYHQEAPMPASQPASQFTRPQYRPFFPSNTYSIPLFLLLHATNSYTHPPAVTSINAVAAHVMPKNVFPFVALIPMSAPLSLTSETTFETMAVTMAEAMPRVRKAS